MTIVADVLWLRSADDADEPLRRTIFRGTRADELAAIGWSDAMIDSFCDQQYDARAAGYALAHPHATRSVIVDAAGVGLGEIIVDTGRTTTVIVDIALLPDRRGSGIGTRVLEQVLAQADDAGHTVELTVDRTSRARSLYERLGFVVVDTDDLHHRMRRDALRKESA